MRVKALKFHEILVEKRLSGKFYLNADAINSRAVEENKDRCKSLSVLANVFNPPIFKRQFCSKEGNSVPYCQSSDVPNAHDGSEVFINKHQAEKSGVLVKEKQILITGFGTIGNIRLVNELSNGIAYANNVCRVEVKDLDKVGYIYAFLNSKFGRAQLNKNASGSVVRFIEAPGIRKTLIPSISVKKQTRIHDLIMDSYKLRMSSNKHLIIADKLFHELNNIQYKKYHLAPKENIFYNGFKHKINQNSLVSLKAKNHSKRIIEIKEKWKSLNGIKLENYIVSPFKIGPRGSFQRIANNNVGTEMISQMDLHKSNPKNFKRVIIKRHNQEDFANENQVLFPAVGNGSSEGEILFRPTLAYLTFQGKLLSGDIGRLECESLNHAAYLYSALNSKGGFRMMRAFYYGTQLRRPTWELLKDINIPIKNKKCFLAISSKVIQAFKLRNESDKHENLAIKLIENEIESWQ